MPNAITTHILDTSRGVPAQGVAVRLFACAGDRREQIAVSETNADGRCDTPMLSAETLPTGTYELVFAVGDYLKGCHDDLPEPLFLDDVVIRFGLFDGQRSYHVPLLISPYGYSTYLGS